MRCPNCGWVNPDGIDRCEKCNTQLKSIPTDLESVDPQMRSTVREIPNVPFFNQNQENSCPNCGYPVRPETAVCPNCGAPLKQEIKKAAQHVSPAPRVDVSGVGATVNPWSNPGTLKSFKLQPVAWENEEKEIQPIQYNGERVELTRENTDPLNNTITTKVQAEIISEDGKWYVIDKSSQQSTFVQASRKLELCDGDVLVLGNRKFVFKG